MTDINTNNDEEKQPLNDPPEELDDSKAHFLNGGKNIDDTRVVIAGSSGSDTVSFTGLGKEDLMKYENDPFWKKVRLILLILFWVGWIGMLVAAIIIIVLAPRCPHRPDLKWYDTEVFYQIYPKSFKDTTKDATSPGKGIGDINGILDKVDYIKNDVGAKVLYINSFYASDNANKDGMDYIDQKAIDPIFGTMADFEKLRKETKKKEMHLVLDFIPNHTGKNHKWFLDSIQRIDPYTDYYVWADCDPSKNTYPNNWMSVYGGRAWSYDDTRKQCYLHQMRPEEPDLDFHNEKVQQEMESVLRFWLDKGVDGFQIVGAQYLFENKSLENEQALVSNPTKYNDYDHSQTTDLNETLRMMNRWNSLLNEYNTKPGREKALIVTIKGDMNTTKKYYQGGSGATIARTSPLDEDKSMSLAARIETKINEVMGIKPGWMFGDQDSSRLASIEGSNAVKALLTLQMLLPGVAFNYYGDEIAMTNYMNIPANLTKDTVKPSRDPYRTPMQWNDKGTGFSMFKSWLPLNPDYVNINVETEKAFGRGRTTLNVVNSLITLRKEESFQFGEIKAFKDDDLLLFTRKAEGFKGYLVALNLGTSSKTENFDQVSGLPESVTLVYHTHKDDKDLQLDLSDRSFFLEAFHGAVFEYEK